jgi:hypothetical protein
MASRTEDDQAWLERQFSDEPDEVDRPDEQDDDAEVPAAGPDWLEHEEGETGALAEPVDLDDPPGTDGGAGDPEPRFDRKVATWLGALGAAAVVAAIVGAVVFYSGPGDEPAPAAASVVDPVAVVTSAAPKSTPDSGGDDRPLPYSADAANSCPAGGSTPAQTMAANDSRSAFVCVRGGVDGQRIDITLDKMYMITAISLTPGWVGPDSSGKPQWSEHRVVTLVQYMFNDTDATVIEHDTKNVHGESVKPVKRVMASKITMLIRQTSRPPADTPPPSPSAAPGLSLPSVFGGGAASTTPTPPSSGLPLFGDTQSNSDPVDATFAIGSLKIIGHEPV